MDLSKISVVVPVRNEAANIARFAASLPSHMPLILIDAGQDDTGRICTAQHANTWLVRSQTRIAEARNLGAALARSEWVLFSDADVEFTQRYFPLLSSLHPRDCLYGTKTGQGKYAPFYRTFAAWQGHFHHLGIPAVSGSNLLVRKAAFFAAGGFDNQLLVNEDTEFGYRLRRLGGEVSFEPRLTVNAFDHRRLQRGALRKNLHSLLRCALIYLNLFPRLWRGNDWGYWASQERSD